MVLERTDLLRDLFLAILESLANILNSELTVDLFQNVLRLHLLVESCLQFADFLLREQWLLSRSLT